MIVGFTGTQRGMSAHQLLKVEAFLRDNRHDITALHHGDCVGADKEANDLARIQEIETGGHPPIDEKKRAFCECDIWFPPMEYLDRNHNIVDMCDILLVAPLTDAEQLRSGTWATYRYALLVGRDTIRLARR